MTLTEEQIHRYARHIVIPEIGGKGQEKLLAAKVLLVGAGGLGSPVALYLAGAGVGTLGIMDGDTVSLSNLQRQIIHTTADIGRLKVDSAKDAINHINPDVQVITYPEYASVENILQIMSAYDLVLDCCDNFATRYLVNDAAVLLKKPFIYGSVMRFDGQAAVFYPPQGPCYRCLFPEAPPPGAVPTCQEAGVMGVLPGLIGMVQATETIKFILGAGDLLLGKLLVYDALAMDFMKIQIGPNPECAVCGNQPTITALHADNYQQLPCPSE
ncbi:MAG: molybdopterin-synthase adenylyltransferase MoeB [Firmicutes bacterium]|nr:molybdopterin-synthase adenylyltransferase MoeB [Bacillota bacterium]